MKQPLRLTHHEFAVFYTQVCDVIARSQLRIPVTDEFMYASAPARKLALEISDRLANEGFLEYR